MFFSLRKGEISGDDGRCSPLPVLRGSVCTAAQHDMSKQIACHCRAAFRLW